MQQAAHGAAGNGLKRKVSRSALSKPFIQMKACTFKLFNESPSAGFSNTKADSNSSDRNLQRYATM